MKDKSRQGPMTQEPTQRARRALTLYDAVIRACFTTQAARAEAIGLTRQALRTWDHGQLRGVNERSFVRLMLVAEACERLHATRAFRTRASIGAYLLGPCMLDSPVRRLDLVLTSGDPEVAVELANAERQALAHLVVERLPSSALTEDAWKPILASLPARAKAEHERVS